MTIREILSKSTEVLKYLDDRIEDAIIEGDTSLDEYLRQEKAILQKVIDRMSSGFLVDIELNSLNITQLTSEELTTHDITILVDWYKAYSGELVRELSKELREASRFKDKVLDLNNIVS